MGLSVIRFGNVSRRMFKDWKEVKVDLKVKKLKFCCNALNLLECLSSTIESLKVRVV